MVQNIKLALDDSRVSRRSRKKSGRVRDGVPEKSSRDWRGRKTWKGTKKGLSEIQEGRAVSKPSGIQTPHFLALKPKRGGQPPKRSSLR